jgi:hypothetical protein
MTPQTNQIYSIAAQTGVNTGSEYGLQMFRQRDQITVNVSISAGTATYVIEGRNSPNDAWTQLATGSASAAANVVRTSRIRCRLSAATGATVIVSLGEMAKFIA